MKLSRMLFYARRIGILRPTWIVVNDTIEGLSQATAYTISSSIKLIADDMVGPVSASVAPGR